MEKNYTQEIVSKPATIRSNHKSKFVIEISNEKESKILPTITSLAYPQFQERVKVETVIWDYINEKQGLIYIHDYNIPDIEECGNKLKEEYNLLDVKKSNLDNNQNHFLYSTPTNYQRKRTTEIHRDTGRTNKNQSFRKFWKTNELQNMS